LVALLVQFYLFVMVSAFWVSVTIRRLVLERRHSRQIVSETVLTGLSVVLVMAIAGYFSSGNSSEEGFGEFRADLATFIDPETVTTTKWSQLLPDQPVVPANTNGTFEGFAFLGLGVLLAVLISLLWMAYTRFTDQKPLLRKHLDKFGMLTPVAIGCFIFSLSNVITFRVERFIIPIPSWAQWFGDTLRASGRFTWPFVYLIMLIALSLVSMLQSKKVAYVLFVSLLGIQVADSSNALLETGERFKQFDYPDSVLRSSAWSNLARGKSRLVIDPPQYKGNIWQDFAEFAINTRMSTNASYLSRVNYEQLYESEVSLRNQLLTRQIRSDTLYVVLPRSGAYRALRLSLGERDGRLAPDISAQFVDGMLVIRRDS
jgi:hypothetical protein